MKIRPLNDRVIVKRMEVERKTASGIVIPNSSSEKSNQGEVIAVGKGKVGGDGKLQAMSVKVGDRVMFDNPSYSDGGLFIMDNHEYLSMREDDIIGVLEA